MTNLALKERNKATELIVKEIEANNYIYNLLFLPVLDNISIGIPSQYTSYLHLS